PCPRRRRPPPSPPLPYTTLFRSGRDGADQPPAAEHDASAGALSPEDGAGARSAATATDGSVSADPVGSAGTSASPASAPSADSRSEEHTSELQSRFDLVCRLLLE